MTTTSLAYLINRMNAYTAVRNMDEVLKVNALDQALRMFRTTNNPPWTKQKTTLRVFKDVPLYPTPSDFAQLAILNDPIGKNRSFAQQPRYVYNNVRDFLEQPTGRNTIAEVWEQGTKMLGIRLNYGVDFIQTVVDTASTISDWAGGQDAGTPVLDNVIFLSGSTSIRFPITFSSGTARMINTLSNPISDSSWDKKYFFVSVYLETATAPTDLTITLFTDPATYLVSPVLTTQFGGQPLIANDWNTFAFNLDTATDAGGDFAGDINYIQYDFTETVNGFYYFDESFLRGWVLQDMWYYSTYNVLNGTTYQDFFSPDSANYSLTSVLLGDTNWHDALVYEACLYLLSDQKETKVYNDVSTLRDRAWEKFFARYPDDTPQITTNYYRFYTNYQDQMGYPDNFMRG